MKIQVEDLCNLDLGFVATYLWKLEAFEAYNAGSYWCAAGHQTLCFIPSLLVLGTRSRCATNEQ